MSKKPRKTYPHEELIANFLKYSISSRSTFHPNQWSSGKEPADIVIAVGRVVLFVNAHKSVSYFETMVEHNLNQARERIVDWRSGRQIRGMNEWRTFVIDWSDVDYIHVVSVVDGQHAAAMDHSLADIGMDEKVRLCTTLTLSVITHLAELGGSARDLIELARAMRSMGKLSEAFASNLLEQQHNYILHNVLATIPKVPKLFGAAIINGREVSSFQEFRDLFESIRKDGSDASDVFSDLSWREVFAISAFVTDCSAEMERLSHGRLRSAVFGDNARVLVAVTSNANLMAANKELLFETAKREKCCISYYLQLSPFGPISFFALLERNWPSATEIALGETTLGFS